MKTTILLGVSLLLRSGELLGLKEEDLQLRVCGNGELRVKLALGTTRTRRGDCTHAECTCEGGNPTKFCAAPRARLPENQGPGSLLRLWPYQEEIHEVRLRYVRAPTRYGGRSLLQAFTEKDRRHETCGGRGSRRCDPAHRTLEGERNGGRIRRGDKRGRGNS